MDRVSALDKPYHRTLHRVAYAETDAMGVVYYANYLIWFERGRSGLMRGLGSPYSGIEARGFYLPVVEASVRYKKSARYDDEVSIHTRIDAVERSSIRFSYEIRDLSNILLAHGETRHGFTNREGRLVKIPPDIRALLSGSPSDDSRGPASEDQP